MIAPIKTTLPNPADMMKGQRDAPMTEVQASKLSSLCHELDEPFDSQLTQWQAGKRIAALEEMRDDKAA